MASLLNSYGHYSNKKTDKDGNYNVDAEPAKPGRAADKTGSAAGRKTKFFLFSKQNRYITSPYGKDRLLLCQIRIFGDCLF